MHIDMLSICINHNKVSGEFLEQLEINENSSQRFLEVFIIKF